ncbi:hypothetical protein DICVIV_09586 [Dictyocaulus viviparus]|uniref:WD domain, G-beta repeat protein n=1 Tax=Dictyocaulus viviparus TaxID=29172 RepID=A0A0D8XI98_DICVI|nr:hypothetical protein DICVIV_09586 [Dictyocaulus viviparus]
MKLHSLIFEPRKPSIVQFTDNLTMTDNIKTHDVGIDTMKRRSIGTQTEIDEKKPSTKGVIIQDECTSIPLAVCPSCSAWSIQGVLAVGDVAGNIHIVINDAVVSTTKVHLQFVSSISWISKTQFISCGTDGNVVILQFKGTSIETIKSVRLSVVDLPRNIRKSSTSVKSLSIVAMSRYDSEVCIGTETGGLWIASLPDLHLKAVPSIPQAIQSVLYMSPFIIISGDDESTTMINCDGSFVESIAIAAKHLCKIDDDLFIMTDNSRIVIYDKTLKKIMYDENRSAQCLTVTPLGDIVLLSENQLIALNLLKSCT